MRDLKLITASIVAILVAILVVQNTKPVETHLLFATVGYGRSWLAIPENNCNWTF
jgi:uncharacterized integral membrane protein